MKISLSFGLLILAFFIGTKGEIINHKLPKELASIDTQKDNLEELYSSGGSKKLHNLELASVVNRKYIIEFSKLIDQLSDSFPLIQAHNVEVSGNVACTFHITPNHNPKVGESSQAWFALTRKGGKSIPFSECDCELNVYSQPRNPESQPIMNPTLEGIDTEQYQDIPGANIVFPKAGVYDLEIIGKAKDGNSFQPFKFTYSVIVTTD